MVWVKFLYKKIINKYLINKLNNTWNYGRVYTVEGDVRDDGAKYSYEISMSGMNGVKCPHGGAVCQYKKEFNRVVGASDSARFYIDCWFLSVCNKALNTK